MSLKAPIFKFTLTKATPIQDVDLSSYKIYIDNTPFPNGVIDSKPYPYNSPIRLRAAHRLRDEGEHLLDRA